MNLLEIVVLSGSALIAGMVNAVAGGGTMLTFPALLFTGTSPVIANATSTLGLTTGMVGSIFGFRRQIREVRPLLRRFVPVSIAGGLLGAVLLSVVDDKLFSRMVPFLLLFATLLFLLNGVVRAFVLRRIRAAGGEGGDADAPAMLPAAACVALQFGTAVYGGYFGAGIGIIMLAMLGLMGLSNIHQMNALKNLLGALINAVAAVWFVIQGMVDWPRAGVMIAGSLLGYWAGAHFSQKIPQKLIRGIVVGVGLTISTVLFFRMLGGK